MNRIIKWAAASIGAAMAVNSFALGSQTTYPVALNNLTIDSPYSLTVTDPGTGVVFSNPVDNGGANFFIIDYFNAYSSLPHITPGRILSTEGYVGNGGASDPADFSFTMTLPTPASGVNMIMDYASAASGPAGSVLLQGYNSSNTVVAMDQVTPPVGFFDEQPLALTSSSNNIVKVTLTPTNIADNFGAISYTVTNVPEPGSFLVFGIATALGVRRRSRAV